jgi:hypothetical protein
MHDLLEPLRGLSNEQIQAALKKRARREQLTSDAPLKELLGLIQRGDDAQQWALEVLFHLTDGHASAARALDSAGAMPILLRSMLRQQATETAATACVVAQHLLLSSRGSALALVHDEAQLADLVALLAEPRLAQRMLGLLLLFNMVNDAQVSLRLAIGGAAAPLAALLSDRLPPKYERLLVDVVCTMTCVKAAALLLTQEGVAPSLLRLLAAGSCSYVKGTAAKNLGLLCAMGEEAGSKVVLHEGATFALLALALRPAAPGDEDDGEYARVEALRALEQLCGYGGCEPKHDIVASRAGLPGLVGLLASPRASLQVPAAGLLGTMSRCGHVVEGMLQARVPAALVRLLPAARQQGRELQEAAVMALRKMTQDMPEYWGQAGEELAALEQAHGAAAVKAMARQVGLSQALQQHKERMKERQQAGELGEQGQPGEEEEEGEEEGSCAKLPLHRLGRMTAALAAGEAVVAAGEAGEAGACASCGVLASPLVRLKKCAGCRQLSFCSPQCQKRLWKEHKPACLAAQGK